MIKAKNLFSALVAACAFSSAALALFNPAATFMTANAQAEQNVAVWDILTEKNGADLSAYTYDHDSNYYVNMEHCTSINIITQADSVTASGYNAVVLGAKDKSVALSSNNDLYAYYTIKENENTDTQKYYSEYISEVNIVTTADKIKLTSGRMMFYNYGGEQINGLENFDTYNVKDLSYMFYECSALTSVDVSAFDTENVTDMSYTFFHCNSLQSIDLSNFETQNVTTFAATFAYCSNLTSVQVSDKFDVGMVRTTYHMFHKTGEADKQNPCTVYGATAAAKSAIQLGNLFSGVRFAGVSGVVSNVFTTITTAVTGFFRMIALFIVMIF